MSTNFPVTERTRLRRRPQRGFHDEAAVFAILDAGVLCHIGYVIDGQAFVTPTAYWREGRRLYWHGSAASRMLRHQAEGVPVCVTVSHLDGFVLARSGFSHSLLYRSVMAFGRASAITDRAEKAKALEAFIDRLYPGRSRALRPMRPAEIDATSVMTMVIEEASAKIRGGGVNEKDEADYAHPVWAGVVPAQMTVGAPVPDARLAAANATLPTHVSLYAEGRRLDDVLAAAAGRKAG